jgi:uncharacterized protein with ATP-grasp and redox domains
MQQARSLGRLLAADAASQRRLCDAAGHFMSTVNTDLSPPENALVLYARFADILGTEDPFAQVKQENNHFALALREEIREQIKAAADPLKAAVRFAIGANIIDYAAQHVFDAAQTMQNCLKQAFVIDDFALLEQALQAAKNVLYLCDNCGEIVFDALLIEQLHQRGCQVTAAVRGGAIINDATLEDAEFCGLTALCSVISSGLACPGSPLALCSEAFRAAFQAADLIISKGMGNFETLSEEQAPIFFLFTVKCSQVAQYLSQRQGVEAKKMKARGEMVLLAQQDLR